MTKKLAGLTGWTAVMSTSLFLVLAILISPLGLSNLNVTAQSCPVLQSREIHTVILPDVAKPEGRTLEPIYTLDPATVSTLVSASPSTRLFEMSHRYETMLASRETAEKQCEDASPKKPVPYVVNYIPTKEEINMLLYCIDHETANGSLEHRLLIAQVVMNRVQSKKFPNTIKGVLTAPGQFDGMAGYENRTGWTPSAMSQEALDLLFLHGTDDISGGAMYFCNPYIVGPNNWFDNCLEAVCEIEKHRFYR